MPTHNILILFLATVCFGLYAFESAAALAWSSMDNLAGALGSVSPIGNALRRRRGRPRKFTTPSRAVTLTLPETVISRLTAVDPDLSLAVVAIAKRRTPTNGRPPAELAVFGRRAVITIRPTVSLEQRTGIHLVPLPDGRALISFDHAKTIAELELLLYDALEDPKLEGDDRKVFESIGAILRDARRANDVTLVTASIIVLESSDRSGRAAAALARSHGR